MKTMAEQRQEAADQIAAAFRSFGEARRHLTIWEFQEHVAKHLVQLGGQGFVASIGNVIVAGAAFEQKGAGK
jgi:hypothetical protein